jgi:hypothetical protein
VHVAKRVNALGMLNGWRNIGFTGHSQVYAVIKVCRNPQNSRCRFPCGGRTAERAITDLLFIDANAGKLDELEAVADEYVGCAVLRADLGTIAALQQISAERARNKEEHRRHGDLLVMRNLDTAAQ